jgi:hypothetical protein
MSCRDYLKTWAIRLSGEYTGQSRFDSGTNIDSSVGIALGYGLDDRGSRVRFPAGAGNFSLGTTESRTALGPTQPPIQWVPGALSLGVKRPGREADHSPHLVPRLKNEWSYTSTPPIRLMAWCLAKARGHLYLYLLPFYCRYLRDVRPETCVCDSLLKGSECFGY